MVTVTAVAQPAIETERFVLRPLRKSDRALIDLHAGDARIARMTSRIPHPLPPGATDAFIERALSDERDEDVWAMDGAACGESDVMGIISLRRLDRNQCETSYWVAPPYWNSGLAAGALGALLKANPLNRDSIFASVFQDNPASSRVLLKCGFDYLGDAESYCLARDANVPTWTFSRKLRGQ